MIYVRFRLKQGATIKWSLIPYSDYFDRTWMIDTKDVYETLNIRHFSKTISPCMRQFDPFDQLRYKLWWAFELFHFYVDDFEINRFHRSEWGTRYIWKHLQEGVFMQPEAWVAGDRCWGKSSSWSSPHFRLAIKLGSFLTLKKVKNKSNTWVWMRWTPFMRYATLSGGIIPSV